MAKLTAAQRHKLPASVFAGPGRSYPIPDASHAIAAERLSARGVKAGNITPAQRKAIVMKAKTKLAQVR